MWRAAAAVDRLLSWRGRDVVQSLGLVVLGFVLILGSWGDVEAFNQQVRDERSEARAAAEADKSEIDTSVRDVAVALDFARGREKAVAAALYEQYGYVLSGLEVDLPARKSDTEVSVADLCPNSSPSTSMPTPVSGKEAREALVQCWREQAQQARNAEQVSMEVTAAASEAGAALKRGAFDAVREAAGRVREGANRLPKPTQTPTSSSPSPSGTADRTPSERAVARAGVVYNRADPLVWPYYLACLLTALAGGWALLRREPFAIDDKPEVSAALKLWSRLLVADAERNSPREIKRFFNRARYYAMRLRAAQPEPGPMTRALRRLLPSTQQPAPVATSLPEASIVALTAVHYVDRHLLPGLGADDKPSAPDTPAPHSNLETIYCALTEDHRKKRLGEWPPSGKEVEAFLAVAGEFAPTPEATERRVRTAPNA